MLQLLIGFSIAVVIALTGVGAGVVTAPLLILFLHVPVEIAVSTALAYAAVGEGQVPFKGLPTMLGAAPEQRDLDVLVLVKARECPDTVGGGVPGGEQDRPHRSTCS